MIIKIILIGLVVLAAGWFIMNRSKAHARAGVRLLVILFAVVATITIVFPGISNEVANIMGVGRGADLILYLLTLLFLFFCLSYYVRSKDEHQKIVLLARKIAIIEANESDHNKRHFKK